MPYWYLQAIRNITDIGFLVCILAILGYPRVRYFCIDIIGYWYYRFWLVIYACNTCICSAHSISKTSLFYCLFFNFPYWCQPILVNISQKFQKNHSPIIYTPVPTWEGTCTLEIQDINTQVRTTNILQIWPALYIYFTWTVVKVP